jgi:hypothetical protein
VWRFQTLKDINMNTRISQKLTAVAMAILMNAAIMGGVSYLFSDKAESATSAQRFARHDGGAVGISARVGQFVLCDKTWAISI